jgi:uncharacterized protein (DUF1330 family)
VGKKRARKRSGSRPNKKRRKKTGTQKTPHRDIVLLGLALALLAGPAMIALGLWRGGQALESKAWPSVQGEVTSSEVKKTRRREPGGDPDDKHKSWTTYSAQVKYAYEVGGKRFESYRIAFDTTEGRSEARKIVARFPKGAVVDVFYDSDEPGESVLVRGGSALNSLTLNGIAVILAGIVVALMARFRRPEQD